MRKKTDLSLYVIIDADYLEKIKKDYRSILIPSLKAGATTIQLRSKKLHDRDFLKLAVEIKALVRLFSVPFIINDRARLVTAAGADGVHLGRDDMPVWRVRSLLGKNKIIGLSASNEKEADDARLEKADYMGLGPVFKTKNKKTKPLPAASLKKIMKKMRLPVVAIGGIKEYNINVLKKAGVKNFCFISEIADAGHVFNKVKRLKRIINL